MSPCQTCVLDSCACTSVKSFRIFDGWLAVYVKDNINPTTLSTHNSTMAKTYSASCANVLLLPFILCTRPIPSMIHVDGVGIASAGETFFSSSLASAAALFVFRRDPSAFASAYGSGPSGWVRTSFMFTLLLSATRIIWLKNCLHNYMLASRSGCLCADSGECLQSLLRHLVVEFHGWWIVV